MCEDLFVLGKQVQTQSRRLVRQATWWRLCFATEQENMSKTKIRHLRVEKAGARDRPRLAVFPQATIFPHLSCFTSTCLQGIHRGSHVQKHNRNNSKQWSHRCADNHMEMLNLWLYEPFNWKLTFEIRPVSSSRTTVDLHSWNLQILVDLHGMKF